MRVRDVRIRLAVAIGLLHGGSLGPAGAAASTLVVLNKAEATASLIDLGSGEEVARVPTGNGPHEVAVAPDGRTAVASNYGVRGAPGNTLTVIDVPSARAVKTIDLGEYTRPHGIAWFTDGRRVAVTAEGKRALLVVDVDKGAILSAIDTDQRVSHMVALTPDEKRAFVANIGSGSMTAIDLEKGERIANIETGDGAEGIAVTPDGKHVWVTNRGVDTVTILDTRSLEIVETLECGSFPIRVRATPDGRWVLVTNARSGELAIFDAVKLQEHRRITMQLEASETRGRLFGDSFDKSSVPIGVLVEPDGKRAFVAHANADVVSVVDLENWKISGSVRGGKEPDGLGFSRLDVEKTARSRQPAESEENSP
ncbi:MAG: cytochrome D1 domain-containing protein [Candidatus Krumholzibacteriia bacterium]